MRKVFLLVMSMIFVLSAFTQNILKGKVFDLTTRAPLAGVNLKVSGQSGTTTDKDGNFAIRCNPPLEIVVSYVGYATLQRKVTACNENLSIGLTPEGIDLNEIEITASSVQNKTLLQQPLSIVKLDEQELERGQGLYLDDAINTNVPGVFMERRTVSAGQQFNIRGYGNGVGFRGASNNFDSQGSKVYLNGIPITDAEGITLMDDIDFNSIGKVEVSKGPSGTLYGLAIAGVVNLQTKKAGNNETEAGQEVMIGSDGLLRTTTHIAIGSEHSSLMVNYGHQKYDGFMDHTASHKDFVNVMGDFELNDKQNISTYFGFADSYDERNGELTIEQYETKDYTGNSHYIKNDAHSAVRTFRAGLSHTYRFNENISNSTTVFGASQRMDNSSAGGWTDKTPLNYGFRSTFDMHFHLSEYADLTGVTGLEMQKTESQVNGYRMSTDSTNPVGYNVITDIRSLQITTSSTASYFTQWTLGLPGEFDITAGVGFSTMKISLADRLWAASNNYPGNNTPKVFETTYNDMVSPTLALNKEFNRSLSVYASYSVAYKAPVSSNILISTTGELNTGLKPERGDQVEIGTKGSLMNNRLFYTLAFFNAQFEDKMTTVAVQNPGNTATLYTYLTNGGSQTNNGIELLVKYDAIRSNGTFVRLLQPFVNLTYSDFTYDNFQYQRVGEDINGNDSALIEDYSGNQVAGVPPVVFNVGFDVDTRPGFYGNLHLNYRDAMYFTSDNKNQTDSYTVLNGKIGYRKSFNHLFVDAYFGANNITGEQYYYMVFLNQLPDAYLPAPYEINFYGGMSLVYRF